MELESARRSLDARLADWEARLDRLDSEKPPEIDTVLEPPAKGEGHLLFVPSPAGYELMEGVGESPSPGDLLEVDGREGRYPVTRIVRSPLPGDGRRCAYLEPI
jgi:hypothetical protein